MRRIRYDETALLDLDWIFQWIAADNPVAAVRTLDRIAKTIEGLANSRPAEPAGSRALSTRLL